MNKSKIYKVTLLGVFFLCNLCMSHFAVAKENYCSRDNAIVAEEAIDNLKGWEDIYKWFYLYSQCDSGGISEGISEVISILLANKWNDYHQFVELHLDKGFENFIIHHIDETINMEDIKKITFNAQKKCPKKSKYICINIIKAIKYQTGYRDKK